MFRAGFIAIIGRPNVGKSTLLNAMLGQKVAVTSSRVQTTRNRIRGVLTVPERGQMVFLDTPGFSKPLDQLGDYMTAEGHQAIAEADAVMLVMDAALEPGKGDEWLVEQAYAAKKPALMIVNKIDELKTPALKKFRRDAYAALWPEPDALTVLSVSARTGKNIASVSQQLLRMLPAGEAIYDEETVTDQTMRTMAQEMIREKVMRFTEDELPHSVAVLLEAFDESDPECTRIKATLYVDQTSQKGMVIGKNGQMIRKIGQAAREDIEAMTEQKIFLDLHVKVKTNWRKDAQFLKQVGLG